MKKISQCQECGRNVYTNDLNLCKRCHQEVGLDIIKAMAPEDLVEEVEEPDMAELGLEETSEEETPSEEPAEEPKEEPKEEPEEKPAEEKKE